MSDVTDVVTEIAKKENPLLKRKSKFPGETFRIPSRGLMYFNGELDEEVKDGEVVVYPMTTLDEIYMKTPDMLFQGTAIESVFQRCIPQVKKPMQLYANDVDFLLTCLRKVSYGEYVPITHICPHCPKEKAKPNDYNIPLNYFILNCKQFEDAELSHLKMTLSTGEKLILRPSTFQEMMRIMQIDDIEIKSPEEMNDLLISTIASTVRKVNDVEDKTQIEEWLKTLPTKIISEFSTDLERLNRWGPNFEYTIECKDCNKSQKIKTIINPLYFFTLPSSPKTT